MSDYDKVNDLIIRRLDRIDARLETALTKLNDTTTKLIELESQIGTISSTVSRCTDRITTNEKDITILKNHPVTLKASIVDQIWKWILAALGIIATGFFVTHFGHT